MRLIDSHCHLNYEGLVERQAEALDNARERGVAGFLNISTRQREWGDIIRVAERDPDVWASVGVPPHEADAHPDLGGAERDFARGLSRPHAGKRDRLLQFRRQPRQKFGGGGRL